jgi:uncharacterized protein
MSAPESARYTVEPLLEAIREGAAARVRELLETDPALVRARAPDGASAILFAIYWGHPEMVELFEQNGALLNLFEACAAGRRSRVEVLLERAPMLANGHSADGYPALGLAVFFGHEDIAQLLVEHGADVNAPSKNAQRVTPLHAAVARRNVKLVRELLERGADPNAEQAGGFTPLHGAAYHGDPEVIEALLGRGADAQKKTTDGKTPADLAREHGNPAIAERLDAAAASGTATV